MNARKLIYRQVSILLTVLAIVGGAKPIWAQDSCDLPKRFSELPLFVPQDEDSKVEYLAYLQNHKDKFDRSTANWALEYSGADLANNLLSENLQKIPVAVLDTSFDGYLDPKSREAITFESNEEDNHGSYVSNIISDSDGLSSGKLARIKFLLPNPPNPEDFGRITDLFSQNGYPSVMNNSQLNYLESWFLPHLQNWLGRGMIFVGSGGNSYPGTFPELEIYNKIFITGWLDNDGLYHSESTEGDHIDLVAPAGISMLVKGDEDQFSFFGGSSAAAPHVTGVIANLISILGKKDFVVIENILKRSSIPFPLANNRNGSGTLNAFKAVKVASGVKEICKDDLACMRSEVIKKNTYEFKITRDHLVDSILTSQRQCNQSILNQFKHEEPCELTKKIQSLRTDFFLTQNSDSAAALSCIYESLEFPGNARFYRIYGGLENPEEYIKRQDDNVFFRHAPLFKEYPESHFSDRLAKISRSASKEAYDEYVLAKIIDNAQHVENPEKYNAQIFKLASYIGQYITDDGQNLGIDYIKFNLLLKGNEFTNSVLIWLIQNKVLGQFQIRDILCLELEKYSEQKQFSKAFRVKGVDLKPYQDLDLKKCSEIHR